MEKCQPALRVIHAVLTNPWLMPSVLALELAFVGWMVWRSEWLLALISAIFATVDIYGVWKRHRRR